MKRRKKEANKPLYAPFTNPFEGYFDSDAICSEPDNTDLDKLDLHGLIGLANHLSESLASWEDFLYDDMNRYEGSYFSNNDAKMDLVSDRRQVQLLKVELREVERRIRMMMNNSSEGELLLA